MKLTINHRLVVASPGETVYSAAKKAGIAIPGLCASDHLNPFGSCRLCLCEVEGQAGLPASCTTPVREGMVVHTESERLTRLRRNILELYRSEQPAGGEHPEALERLAKGWGWRRYGIGSRRCARRSSTTPIRFSRSTMRSVSPAPAACEPAMKSKAPMP